MAHEPARGEARRFFVASGPSYDDVVRWATLGRDAAWKRAMLRRVPPEARDVLDYACGTGLLTLEMAGRAGGRVVGVDLSPSMVAEARAKASAQGAAAEFVLADAETWEPPRAAFDVVLAGYLPKYVALEPWLLRAARALRPGGILLTYDFTYPRAPLARAAWEAWWRRIGPRLARDDAWRDVAAELPGLVRRTRWVVEMQEALPRAGFEGVRERRMTFGAATLVEARRRAAPPLPEP